MFRPTIFSGGLPRSVIGDSSKFVPARWPIPRRRPSMPLWSETWTPPGGGPLESAHKPQRR